jgi:TolB-like protein
MKQITFFFAIIFFNASIINAQTIKVAILDFENISGIAKYNGLGKAMSSMLITDIEANVSPKRLQLVERSQIQKILKEQNFQATSAVDKTSSVKAGKLLGVKYLLVGDIYILNDVLVINARLTDTETGDIKFSKKQEGKLVGWLNLKTNIAKELAKSIALPFTEPNIPDKEINMATITSFGNAITAKDDGKLEKAEELISTVQEFSPDFEYLEDLKSEIDELKKRLEKVEQDVETTTTEPIAAAQNYDQLGNFKEAEKYYQIGLKRLKKNELGQYLLYNNLLSELSFKYQDYEKTLYYCNKILEVYSMFDNAVVLKTQSLLKLKKEKEFIEWSKNYFKRADEINSYKIFDSELSNYLLKNGIEGKINDLTTNTSNVRGFSIEISNYKFYQGDQRIFNAVLGQFAEINNLINGMNSTLIYLKKLNSQPQGNKFDYETNKPYNLPRSQFSSKVSSAKDELVIAKSGELYLGAYFLRSNGTIWTKENPGECPCYKLITKIEYIKLNQVFIQNYWQTSTFQAEGWCSLLNKESVNARKRFGQIIFYLIHENAGNYNTLYKLIDSSIENLDSVKIDGYQGLRDILDRESINYEGKENLNFIEQLCKSEITLKSDDLCNNILNFGHTYLIEGKFIDALKIYKYINLDYTLKDYEFSVRQIIVQDLSEFELKGLITKRDSEFIVKNLN